MTNGRIVNGAMYCIDCYDAGKHMGGIMEHFVTIVPSYSDPSNYAVAGCDARGCNFHIHDESRFVYAAAAAHVSYHEGHNEQWSELVGKVR